MGQGFTVVITDSSGMPAPEESARSWPRPDSVLTEMTVGRRGGDATIELPQRSGPPTLSRRHALVTLDDLGWHVQNTGQSVAIVHTWGMPAALYPGHPFNSAVHNRIALELPGDPSWVVTCHWTGTNDTTGPVARTPPGYVEPARVSLGSAELEAVCRVFAGTLAWPPRPSIRPIPTLGRPATRAAYYRGVDKAKVQGFKAQDKQGVDLNYLHWLIRTGSITYADVKLMAHNCGLDIPMI